MSDYDKYISTGNVGLTPEQLGEIIAEATRQSAVLSLGRRLRNMTTGELKLKVSTALPEVYFVGEKGKSQTYPPDALKKTTKSEWEDVSIYAGELAAIVVIPNNVFNDANFDIFAEVKAQMPGAIAKTIDRAVFYGQAGVDVPDDWSNGIFVNAPASHKITAGTGADVYDDLLGEEGVFAVVEEDGYDVNGIVSATTMKAKLRGLRDGTNGMPLFTMSIQDGPQYALAGVPMTFPENGGFDPSETLLIAGDWNKLVYSIRQDMAFDVFDTGVIQDASGNITHNLMQEDLTALRVTFRMAWGMPLPAQQARVVASGVYPFGFYVPSGV
ncbi:phage major capsid protein, HK97 family [Anaerolinea thermolimosa]|uniref:phage major capsid protein n=1 Tax=Anaerolinea thermolimosa TaxID=229919 RepID=UPI000783D9B4|nr:phage major capsid protein [Anaerolinea thermolimosa]GAP07121.1 phage major capsid protein, HK97 family [Anaerolinea thermolimosa]